MPKSNNKKDDLISSCLDAIFQPPPINFSDSSFPQRFSEIHHLSKFKFYSKGALSAMLSSHVALLAMLLHHNLEKEFHSKFVFHL
jgi:hypothetical protein